MRKLAIWMFGILLALLLLIVGLGLYLAPKLESPAFKAHLIEQIDHLTGFKVTAKDTLSVGWLPTPSVMASNIVAIDPTDPQKKQQIKIKKATMKLSVTSLLTGNMLLKDVTLTKPEFDFSDRDIERFTAHRDALSHPAQSENQPSKQTVKARKKETPALIIKQLTAKQAVVRYTKDGSELIEVHGDLSIKHTTRPEEMYQVNTKGHLQAKNGNNFPFTTNTYLERHATSKGIVPEKTQGPIHQGYFSAMGTWQKQVKSTRLGLQFQADGIETKPLMLAFFPTSPATLTSKAQVTGKLSTHGSSTPSLLRNLNGHVLLQLDPGTITGLKIQESIRQMGEKMLHQAKRKVKLAKKPFEGERQDQVRFSQCIIDSTIKRGVFNINDGHLVSDLFSIVFNGYYDLPRNDMRFKIYLRVKSALSPQLVYLQSFLDGDHFTIGVSGKPNKPLVSPNDKRMLGQVLKRKLQNHLTETITQGLSR